MARLLVSALTLATLASPAAALAAQPAKQAVASTTTTVDGEFEVRIEDYRDGRSRERHFVKTPKGRYELRFDKRPTDLPSGTKVRVHGRKAAGVMALDGAQVQQVSAALSYAMGEQSVAVILVNFADDTSQPITQNAANALVFDTLDNFYQENSFGQTWLAGNTFGYFTIAQSRTVCDPDNLAAQANAAAAAAGVDLSRYKRKVYLHPMVGACQWSGLGHVGGATTNSWVNGVFDTIVVGHELGHNLGLKHAHAKNCDVAPLGTTCSNLDYGDAADMMGNVRAAHFNAFEKERLGWLNDGVSPPMHNVTASGRFTIQPYSSTSVGPKAIKIPKGLDQFGWASYYYVEYRQRVGADSVLDMGNMAQGVVVRMATPQDSNSSFQLDMTPGSSTNTNIELADGALAVGSTYTDAANGVTIKLVSADANGAIVDVTVGTQTTPPPTEPPTGTLTESIGLDKSSYLRGETVSMSALVKKDGVAVKGASVTFTVTLPNASKTTMTATTGTDGFARAAYRTAKGKGAAGSYGVRADASNSGATATASTTFSVK